MKNAIYGLMLIFALTTCLAIAQDDAALNQTENESAGNATVEASNETISIAEVSYLPVEQYVRISNAGEEPVDLTGYVLGIAMGDSFSPIYTFKEFTLDANSTVAVHAGAGTDSQTDLYTGNETMFTEEPSQVSLENGEDTVAVWP
jgi:hypothetical protein